MIVGLVESNARMVNVFANQGGVESIVVYVLNGIIKKMGNAKVLQYSIYKNYF